MTTDQEALWRGDFGDAYTERDKGAHWIASNVALFSKILSRTRGITSVLELGSNFGLNLMALKQLLPQAGLSAVEINQKAAAELKKNIPDIDLYVSSIQDFHTDGKWDFVFPKGVLIHIDPERLPAVYKLMHDITSRHILIAEYYNPVPVEIVYRGLTGKLFKRDFAGDMLDAFTDLTLIDYGFVYHRDPLFPQDDLTYFLLERK